MKAMLVCAALAALTLTGCTPPQIANLARPFAVYKAERGDPEAQVMMGRLYSAGLGGKPQDYELAALWYRKAARQGDSYAQKELAGLYAEGKGVPQDYELAALWYRKAAKQGDSYAQKELAGLYAEGEGVPQDDELAVHWYGKATRERYAQWWLGDMYYGGRGVPQDRAKAALWYRKAAERGYADAQMMLGIMYAFGRGVPQDHVQAYAWYDLAAAAGDVGGRERRDALLERMTPGQIAEGLALSRDLAAKMRE